MRGMSRTSGRLGPGWGLDRQPDRKLRTLALLAPRLDVAAHERHQPPADRQTKARAAILAVLGDPRLVELLEKLRQLIRVDADAGIAHPKLQLLPLPPRGQDHLTLLGELAGV